LLDFRLRLYVLGRNARWMVMALAAGTFAFGGPHLPAQWLAVYLMLGLATVYNLALYVIPWRRLEEQGKGNWVVVPYIIADSICISIVVYFTGGGDSWFFVAYLLLIVWLAVYPGMRGKPWWWMIVVVCSAVAVFSRSYTAPVGFAFVWRWVIFGFVAWLANGIARELHATTSKLDNAVRALTDGLVVLDRNERVMLLNPRAAELLGVSEAEALGQALTDDPLAGSLAPLRKLLVPDTADAAAGDQQVRVHEVAIGEAPARVARVYTAPYTDEMDQWAGELKVLHDVTNLKELDRLRSDFMSAVTHDLRNPLSSIKGILQLLHRRFAPLVDDESSRMLRVAESETDRLVRLANEMLDVARIEAGKLQLSLARVELDQQIAEVVRSVEWEVQQRGLHLTTDIAGDLPPVHADADRLARVIYNLLDNALKFTPRGGSVRISACRCPSDRPLAQVSISDTGPGIPAERLSDIFDRFMQVGDELLHKARGAGLGLPICRDLIAAHGGSLWVESKPGAGTTFHFTVPLAPPAHPQAPPGPRCQ